ncbi:MAG TPA: hypothetical protein VE132_17670, partial [Micromonosporaceae bacterium]|nr:hypothetical protein [Micromonosporaceae bacterium]
ITSGSRLRYASRFGYGSRLRYASRFGYGSRLRYASRFGYGSRLRYASPVDAYTAHSFVDYSNIAVRDRNHRE